ncbi:MAG: 4Fe-4S binding protein [Trichlorobacter sp.]|nr:4Fe-4S binding protein [Trichlorobacter sp.]
MDKEHCIRCWCCRELCPYHAMKLRKGFLLRILNSK